MNCQIGGLAVSGVAAIGSGRGMSHAQADCRVPLLDARLEAAARLITGGSFDSATRRGGAARRDLRSAHRGSATLVAVG
jgi:hypothetical protein